MLSLIFDHAQRRVRSARQTKVVCGFRRTEGRREGPEGQYGWSKTRRSNVWVDPITGSVWLTPRCLEPEWNTTFTGDYARLAKSAYTLTTPASWLEHTVKGSGDIYLASQDVNEAVITVSTWARNRGFFLSWRVEGAGDETGVVLRAGWSDTATIASSSVAIELTTAGEVTVYRNGTAVERKSVVGNSENRLDQVVDQTINLIVVPFRRREIFIASSLGGGFTVEFEDIPDSDLDPTITGATKFWWHVTAPFAPSAKPKAIVQCAPMRYNPSGWVTSRPLEWSRPPVGTGTVTSPGYLPGYGTQTVSSEHRDSSDSGAFVANGSNTSSRIRVSLTSDGTSTAWVQFAQVQYITSTASTSAAEQGNATPFVQSIDLSVPDDPSGVEIVAQVVNVDGFAEVVKGSHYHGNRPSRLDIGSRVVIDGRAEPFEYTQRGPTGKTDRYTLTIRDAWKALENTLYDDATPFDGLSLEDAIRRIVNMAGVPSSEVVLPTFNFTLPLSPGAPSGDFHFEADVGESAADVLRRLMDTYLPTHLYGFRPTIDGVRFVVIEPKDTDQPIVTIWPTLAEARQGLIDSGRTEQFAADNAYRFVYMSPQYLDQVLEPEGNSVYVLGFDYQRRRPIVAHIADTESQAIATLPSARPDNWLGETRVVGVMDPALSTEAGVTRAARIIYNRVTKSRLKAEFHAQFLLTDDNVPIWRGDVVRLAGLGNYRITSLQASFAAEHNLNPGGARHRPTTYTAEFVGTEFP